jgi:hypothetical protein
MNDTLSDECYTLLCVLELLVQMSVPHIGLLGQREQPQQPPSAVGATRPACDLLDIDKAHACPAAAERGSETVEGVRCLRLAALLSSPSALLLKGRVDEGNQPLHATRHAARRVCMPIPTSRRCCSNFLLLLLCPQACVRALSIHFFHTTSLKVTAVLDFQLRSQSRPRYRYGPLLLCVRPAKSD